MSRPATRDAALCRTLKPFQTPESLAATTPTFCARAPRAFSTAAPSGPDTAPAPTMIAGRSAFERKSVAAFGSLARVFEPAPSQL